VSFLRRLESPIGMFKRLFGVLVSSLVIFFPVVCGGGTVRMGREFVKFGSSLVRVIWHRISILGAHLRIMSKFRLSNCGHSFPEFRTPDENRTIVVHREKVWFKIKRGACAIRDSLNLIVQ
jgi:hypothetical protein